MFEHHVYNVQVDTTYDSDGVELDVDLCHMLCDRSPSTDEGYCSMIRCAVSSQIVESLQEKLQLAEKG